MNQCGHESCDCRSYCKKAAPPAELLTDEEIERVIASWWRDDLTMKYAELCRAVERAVRSGNDS